LYETNSDILEIFSKENDNICQEPSQISVVNILENPVIPVLEELSGENPQLNVTTGTKISDPKSIEDDTTTCNSIVFLEEEKVQFESREQDDTSEQGVSRPVNSIVKARLLEFTIFSRRSIWDTVGPQILFVFLIYIYFIVIKDNPG
jgi:hypothetical protein